MERECFVCDEDGHWYQIPVAKKELFEKLLYDEEDETKFIDEFETSGLNMHISNYSFLDCQAI